jgi:hypothetical protein
VKRIVVRLGLFSCVLAWAGLLSSCAVFMAARQPGRKDVALLNPGTPRNLVIAEFGTPIHGETRDGKRTEIFAFVQGYSKGARVSRAIAHGVADFFTLGLWEIAGTPTEAIFDGKDMVVEVTFDPADQVEKAITLKRKA